MFFGQNFIILENMIKLIQFLKNNIFLFEIKRLPYLENWILDYEHKTIYQKDLEKFLKQGWTIENKKIIFLTDFLNNWKKIEFSKKITIIIALIALLISILKILIQG